MVENGKLGWSVLSLMGLLVVGCSDSKREYASGAGGTSDAGAGGTSDAGAGGTSSSGAGGTKNSEAGTGGSDNPEPEGGSGGEPPIETEPGDPCTEDGAIQCAGTNQRSRLECVDGFWKAHDECEEDQRCDTSNADAECQPVLEACADKAPGEGICQGTERSDCGPDLVTLEGTETCDLFCVEHEGKSECSACEAEQFSSDGTPAGCTAWQDCGEGEFVSKDGSATADRECADCEGGYNTAENAAMCTPWTDCTWQLGGLVQAGTETTNSVCGTASPYRQFGTGADDSAAAVATDTSGNVYVAANTQGSIAGPAAIHAAVIRKYTPDGRILWTQQFGTNFGQYGTTVSDVAVDSSGNAYLAGLTAGVLEGSSAGGTDGYLRKYDTNGNVLWTKQFGTSSDDYASSVTLDSSGNVYVAGDTKGTLQGSNAGGRDAFLTRFDSAGTASWTRQWGTSGNEWATDVSANGGHVAVTSGANSLGEVRSYAPNGDFKWALVISLSETSGAGSVAVAGNGDLFVVGQTAGNLEGTNAGGRDAYLRKYAVNGVTAWTRQFGTTGDDQGNSVVLDGSGNIYISGYASGALAGAGSHAGAQDVFVRKYDPTGTNFETEQFGNAGYDYGSGSTIDLDGNLYVVGYTDGGLVGTNAGGDDAFVKQIVP